MIAIPINTIESITFRNSDHKGNGVLKGALWGGAILGLTATVISKLEDDGFGSSGGWFLIGFGVGAIPGALIGIGISSKRTKFYINGDKTSYQRQKEKINQFLLEYQ